MSVRRTFALLMLLVASAAQALADCKTEVSAAILGIPGYGPFRMNVLMTVNGAASQMQGVLKLPDSLDISLPGQRFVVTPNGAWSFEAGHWVGKPGIMREQALKMFQEGFVQGVGSIGDTRCLGGKTYAGETFQGYAYQAGNTINGVEYQQQVTVYLDQQMRPAWLFVQSAGDWGKTSSIQHIEYDAGITINDPQ